MADASLKMLSVRVGEDIFDRVEQLCEGSEPRASRSEIVRRALSVGLAALERRDKKARDLGTNQTS